MKNFTLIFKGLYFGRILMDEKECYRFHETIIEWLTEKDNYQIEITHCDFLQSGITYYEFIGYEPFLPLINEEFAGLIISVKAKSIEHIEAWIKKLPHLKHQNLYIELRNTSELINTNFLTQTIL